MELTTRQKTYIGLGIGASILLAYVAMSVRKQYKLAKSIDFSILSIKPKTISLKELGLTVTMEIVNVSDLNIDINLIDIDVYANGIFVTKVNQRQRQVIRPRSRSSFQFNLFMNPMDLFKNLKVADLSKALDYKNIKMRMVGRSAGTIDGISFQNIPIDLDYLVGDFVSE